MSLPQQKRVQQKKKDLLQAQVQQQQNQQQMKQTSHLLQQKNCREEVRHLCWSSCLVLMHQTKKKLLQQLKQKHQMKNQMRVLLSFVQLHLVWWLQEQQNQKWMKQTSHLLQQKSHQEEVHLCMSSCLVLVHQTKKKLSQQESMHQMKKEMWMFVPFAQLHLVWWSQVQQNQQRMKQISQLLLQKSRQEEVHHFCWSSCLVLLHQMKKDLLLQRLKQKHQMKKEMRMFVSSVHLHLVWGLQVHQMKKTKRYQFFCHFLCLLQQMYLVWRVQVLQLQNQQRMKQILHLLQQKSQQEEVRHFCLSSCLVLLHQTKKDMLQRQELKQEQESMHQMKN